ncbi:MAG: hypothetical protein ACE5GB_14925, partial [Acidimicrobiales bacterium]
YQLVDSTITPGQLFAYRLIERKFLGQTFEHGTGTAIPWSTSPPANFLTVGPLGDYADIQSAINAIATAQPVISVATGTYPSFTITGGLGTMVRIYADGSGPVIIDTTTGPVQILNLTAFDSAELSDLVIGNGASSNIGVLIQNCQGLVILDELEVHGGIGQPGIDVSASVRTTIQKSVVDGTPGVLTENGSLMFMSRGSLDDLEVTGISDATTCQLVTVSTVAPGSSLTELTGTMPDVAVTEFPGLGGPFVVDLQAHPGVLFGLAYSVSVGWAQIPGFEMVGLVNLLTAVPLAQGVLPTGTKTLNLNLPATGAIWGLPIGLQMVAIDLSNVTLRFSNLATIIPTGS